MLTINNNKNIKYVFQKTLNKNTKAGLHPLSRKYILEKIKGGQIDPPGFLGLIGKQESNFNGNESIRFLLCLY